mmetsp:Transcript_28313/g.60358  ORF Transcript_28313/g.60358 Transcript_28313/m.60358 type:complete len:172 (+) Transcript_28313:125-640(+)
MSVFHNTFFLSATVILIVLANISISQAWTWTSTSSFRRHVSSHRVSKTVCKAASSDSPSALYYQNGNCQQEISIDNINDDVDAERRLQAAIEAARDADRRYGLCTPTSTHAWQIVDDIYSSSPVSRQVENNVKKVLGREKSIWSSFERTYVTVTQRVELSTLGNNFAQEII